MWRSWGGKNMVHLRKWKIASECREQEDSNRIWDWRGKQEPDYVEDFSFF